jgi:hypothetical protein
MPSLNHTLAAIAITTLHAYNLAANPRKPAQTLTRAKKTSRKFGLEAQSIDISIPRSQVGMAAPRAART